MMSKVCKHCTDKATEHYCLDHDNAASLVFAEIEIEHLRSEIELLESQIDDPPLLGLSALVKEIKRNMNADVDSEGETIYYCPICIKSPRKHPYPMHAVCHTCYTALFEFEGD